jgi:hypothetical protein
VFGLDDRKIQDGEIVNPSSVLPLDTVLQSSDNPAYEGDRADQNYRRSKGEEAVLQQHGGTAVFPVRIDGFGDLCAVHLRHQPTVHRFEGGILICHCHEATAAGQNPCRSRLVLEGNRRGGDRFVRCDRPDPTCDLSCATRGGIGRDAADDEERLAVDDDGRLLCV